MVYNLRNQYYRVYEPVPKYQKTKELIFAPGTPNEFVDSNRAGIELLMKRVENSPLDEYPQISDEFRKLREDIESEIQREKG